MSRGIPRAVIGTCEICKAPAKYQDHCHDTGRIRGVLCNICNLGLGHYEIRKRGGAINADDGFDAYREKYLALHHESKCITYKEFMRRRDQLNGKRQRLDPMNTKSAAGRRRKRLADAAWRARENARQNARYHAGKRRANPMLPLEI
jgi:hypothetical protein